MIEVPKIISSALHDMQVRVRPVKGVGLFVSDSAVVKMLDHADCGYSEGKEVMGLMIGCIFKDDEGQYSEINDVVTAGLDADDVSVRFERTAFEELFDAIDKSSGDMILGWYHSHPGYGCYLSDTDIRTHQGIFGDGNGFAVVIDPSDGTMKVLTCKDGLEVDVSMIIRES